MIYPQLDEEEEQEFTLLSHNRDGGEIDFNKLTAKKK